MMLSVRRLKQLLMVLVVILLLDICYIYSVYVGYKDKESHQSKGFVGLLKNSLLPGIRLPPDTSFISSYQANLILNSGSLQKYRQSNRANPQAKDTVVLIKTHKTGCSTLLNILLRYAITRNLTTALPVYSTQFFWPYKFHSKFVLKQTGITKHNILAHHSVWNKEEMDKVMKDNPFYVTILRDPVKTFVSAYGFYQFDKFCYKRPIEQFMQSPIIEVLKRSKCPKANMPTRNLLSHDLGLPMSQNEDISAIQELIKRVEQVFPVVLITEYFDESLLLLKKKLGWRMEDIIYFKQNAQINLSFNNSQPNQDLLDQIRNYNYADEIIYQHFKKRFSKQLKQEFTEDELKAELQSLHNKQMEYMSKCVQKTGNYLNFYGPELRMFKPYGANSIGYVLKQESLSDIQCRLLALPELSLTYYLKGSSTYEPPNFSDILTIFKTRW